MTLGALLMRGSGPAGTRTGSVPALKAKLQPAEEFAGMQSDKRSREKAAAAAEIDAIKNSVSFDPEALGLLPVPAPHVAQPRGDQTRLDLMNGSWTVRQIGEAAEAKRAEKAAEEARKQDARAAREQKKEERPPVCRLWWRPTRSVAPSAAVASPRARWPRLLAALRAPRSRRRVVRASSRCACRLAARRMLLPQVLLRLRRRFPVIHWWSRLSRLPTGYQGRVLTLFPMFWATAKCAVGICLRCVLKLKPVLVRAYADPYTVVGQLVLVESDFHCRKPP